MILEKEVQSMVFVVIGVTRAFVVGLILLVFPKLADKLLQPSNASAAVAFNR
jgi:hypothetical protein